MSTFKERVYHVVSQIPKGSVMTYKEVAKTIGSPQASRAVGNILNKNRDFKNIPCHRVVRSDGYIGGYVSGIHTKKELLLSEGIKIKGNYLAKQKTP